MIVEWDEEKDRTNRRKHRISFDEAATIFDDRWPLQLMTLIILRRSAAF
jgi:uncharacterized DUF497 family protein